MAPPFQETADPEVYLLLGAFAVLTVLLAVHLIQIKLRKQDDSREKDVQESDQELRIDNIGLSHKSERLLEQVMENSEMQNELPEKLDVSKATVSNAIKELRKRGLILRKKKGNSYLIEPDTEQIRKEQR